MENTGLEKCPNTRCPGYPSLQDDKEEIWFCPTCGTPLRQLCPLCRTKSVAWDNHHCSCDKRIPLARRYYHYPEGPFELISMDGETERNGDKLSPELLSGKDNSNKIIDLNPGWESYWANPARTNVVEVPPINRQKTGILSSECALRCKAICQPASLGRLKGSSQTIYNLTSLLGHLLAWDHDGSLINVITPILGEIQTYETEVDSNPIAITPAFPSLIMGQTDKIISNIHSTMFKDAKGCLWLNDEHRVWIFDIVQRKQSGSIINTPVGKRIVYLWNDQGTIKAILTEGNDSGLLYSLNENREWQSTNLTIPFRLAIESDPSQPNRNAIPNGKAPAHQENGMTVLCDRDRNAYRLHNDILIDSVNRPINVHTGINIGKLMQPVALKNDLWLFVMASGIILLRLGKTAGDQNILASESFVNQTTIPYWAIDPSGISVIGVSDGKNIALRSFNIDVRGGKLSLINSLEGEIINKYDNSFRLKQMIGLRCQSSLKIGLLMKTGTIDQFLVYYPSSNDLVTCEQTFNSLLNTGMTVCNGQFWLHSHPVSDQNSAPLTDLHWLVSQCID